MGVCMWPINFTSYIPGAYLSSGRGIILSRPFLGVLPPEMGDVRTTMEWMRTTSWTSSGLPHLPLYNIRHYFTEAL